MAALYHIDRERSLIRLEYSSSLDLAEIAESVQALLSDPELQPGMNMISDHSNRESAPTREMVKAVPSLAAELAKRIGKFRCAVVAPSDVAFGMTRMTEAYSNGSDVEVMAFRTVEEAEAWLGESAGRPTNS
jgi:hypothetical protein